MVEGRQMDKSFCFFFQKEALFFFEKKNQKTFTRLLGRAAFFSRAAGFGMRGRACFRW
jgi:hypothetical protein